MNFSDVSENPRQIQSRQRKRLGFTRQLSEIPTIYFMFRENADLFQGVTLITSNFLRFEYFLMISFYDLESIFPGGSIGAI